MQILLEACAETQTDEVPLEISLATALEMVQLEIACLIDIRQTFELDIKGSITNTIHIPFFNIKQFLGFSLTETEQEILDADEPNDLDLRSFIKAMNTLKYGRDCVFLMVCNSGRRSLCATRLLRNLGYTKTFSVKGGVQQFSPLHTAVKV